MTETSENPFASPQIASEAEVLAETPADEAEAIRRKYLQHEMGIKSVGTLYYLGGAILTVVLIIMVVGVIATLANARNAGAGAFGVLLMTGFYAALTVLSFYLGHGLRGLNPKVRTPAGILAAIGLLGFPIGTLINGYILYLLFSEKGKIVFSPRYREVIELTPHVRYKTSLVAWLALVLIIVLVVVLLIVALG